MYDAQSVTVNFNIAALKGPYTEKDKIFFRPTHGGAPELYLPDCAGTDASSDQNRQDIKGLVRNVLDMRVDAEAGPVMGVKKHAFQNLQSLAAMEWIRKKEDSEKAMQELLEEEEEDKKRAAAKASKKKSPCPSVSVCG